MAETSVQGGSSSGPGAIAVFVDAAGNSTQLVSLVDGIANGGHAQDVIGPLTETAPATDTASSGLNGRLQRIAQRLSSLIALFPTALTVGAGALKIGAVIANPTSTLTRPANTTAYVAGNLIANNTVAASLSVPSFTATPGVGGNGTIKKLRLYTDKTSGMNGVTIQIDLWSAAPTFTNGDGGVFAVATGSANWLGRFTVTLVQVGDGAYFAAIPDVGNAVEFALASGQSIFWTMQAMTGFTPASGQHFTVVPEIVQN